MPSPLNKALSKQTRTDNDRWETWAEESECLVLSGLDHVLIKTFNCNDENSDKTKKQVKTEIISESEDCEQIPSMLWVIVSVAIAEPIKD